MNPERKDGARAATTRPITHVDITEPVSADLRQRRQAFIHRYVEAASALGSVSRIFYDSAPGDLKLVTVFTGDRWKVRPRLYEAEAEANRQAPGAHPDVQLLPSELADLPSLKATLRQAYQS